MKRLIVMLAVGCLGYGLSFGAMETGLKKDVTIDTRMFKTTPDYFKAKIPKKIYSAYKNGKSPSNWKDNGMTPEQAVEYKAGEESMVVYVPASYDGTKPYGVYVHISPGVKGIAPSKEWQALMDKAFIWMGADKESPKTTGLRKLN